jgi:hypothetical protein
MSACGINPGNPPPNLLPGYKFTKFVNEVDVKV